MNQVNPTQLGQTEMITPVRMKCDHCGHVWVPRREWIKWCPKCKWPTFHRIQPLDKSNPAV